MPLEVYQRGKLYWVRGRVEYNGRPITGYYRCSTGASTEEGAREWAHEEAERQRRRHLLGESATVTFADAIMLYDAKPKDAGYLMKIIPEIGHLPLSKITPKMIRELGAKLYPNAATDTWWRQVVVPARAVINNAHDAGAGTPPIRVRGYIENERIAQDEKRGRRSRKKKIPFSQEWLDAFCAHADPHNAAMARFMFETAARIDQTISIMPEHLDLMNCRVWLKAQKGHEAQWVTISHEMMIELANLPAKQPLNRKTGKRMPARVFGYATGGGYRKRWATICAAAEIPMLTAHSARHGFYTELRVRQDVDPITAAHAGRWKDAQLPDSTYAHSEVDQAEIRARFRSNREQALGADTPKAQKNGG